MERSVVLSTTLCAVLMGIMLVAAPATAVAQAPVAAYGFGEGAGTAVADASGTGNHGTASGTTWAAMGRYGTALSFSGTTGWVTVPDSASLDLTTGMTLEAWVNPVQVSGGWRTVIFKQSTNGIAYSLFGANGSARPTGQVFIGGEQNAASTSSLPLNAWSHLATTYDGTTLRLYVNGTQVASKAQTGPAPVTTGVLRIGGNSIWGEYFRGLIDEVRIYNRALAAAEIQSDMNTPVAPPVTDSQPPTTPTGLAQTGATETTATIAWNASTDNVAVAGYGLYRAGSPAGSTTATSTTLTGLTCGTSLLAGVDAYDAATNRSAQATITVSTAPCDTSPPTVQLTSPPAGPVSGTVTVAATASDDRGVAGVRFRLDGNTLGSEDTSPPYSISWDTATASAGNHTLTAVARDAATNTTTSAPVAVTVTNSTPSFVNDRVVIGLDEPTNLAFAPDGRMFVTERDGTVWVVQPGADEVDPVPLLQLPSVATDNERGLLGIALDPGFATNGYFYLYFTHGSLLRNRVSRFQVTGGIASTASELVIWQNTFAAAVWHQGGDIHFGPDGYLYIAVGDHLSSQTAQSLTSFNGKILRIAADGSVPTDNPFYDGAGPNADAIWVRGLRNPFRFSIDAPTGRMMIGDVGEGTTEEVNVGVRGANYGWPQCEGSCGSAGMTNPVHSYAHNGRDASVTGGFIYRGTQFPAEYQGSYFFADYAMNWIRRLTFDAAGNVTGVRNFEPPNGAVDGPYGDIVGARRGPGRLALVHRRRPVRAEQRGLAPADQERQRQLSRRPRGPPPRRLTGPAPLTVTFSSAGSADPEGQPITYRWNFGDGDTSTAGQPDPHVRRERALHGALDHVRRRQRDDLGRADHHRRVGPHGRDPRPDRGDDVPRR